MKLEIALTLTSLVQAEVLQTAVEMFADAEADRRKATKGLHPEWTAADAIRLTAAQEILGLLSPWYKKER